MEPWRHEVKECLFALARVLERQGDSKAFAEYCKGIGDDIDESDTLSFSQFHPLWYRRRRCTALEELTKRTAHQRDRGDVPRSFGLVRSEFDTDELLSITDAWDMPPEALRVFKKDVQRCLENGLDFFKPAPMTGRVLSSSLSFNSETRLSQAETAFNSVEKSANGAYRAFKKQWLALSLRPLETDARSHCAGRRIKNDSRMTTYIAETLWSNLHPSEQKQNREKLKRWRDHGEKWLSVEEPSFVLSFRHLESDNQCFRDFERRRLSTSALNAIISTLEAVRSTPGLRELWCRQLSKKHLKLEHHPQNCFCKPDNQLIAERTNSPTGQCGNTASVSTGIEVRGHRKRQYEHPGHEASKHPRTLSQHGERHSPVASISVETNLSTSDYSEQQEAALTPQPVQGRSVSISTTEKCSRNCDSSWVEIQAQRRSRQHASPSSGNDNRSQFSNDPSGYTMIAPTDSQLMNNGQSLLGTTGLILNENFVPAAVPDQNPLEFMADMELPYTGEENPLDVMSDMCFTPGMSWGNPLHLMTNFEIQADYEGSLEPNPNPTLQQQDWS
ncbi:hypothetical protein LOZ58_006882 [Ophidiomyces ophidiicola]|nr:hypothetical protein LOZ58_006882 [Ophidiomyces ophidiicola]